MNFNNITPVVKNLLIINVLVYFGAITLGSSLGEGFINQWLAVHYPTSAGRPHIVVLIQGAFCKLCMAQLVEFQRQLDPSQATIVVVTPGC